METGDNMIVEIDLDNGKTLAITDPEEIKKIIGMKTWLSSVLELRPGFCLYTAHIVSINEISNNQVKQIYPVQPVTSKPDASRSPYRR